MKVKLFEAVVNVSAGGDATGGFACLETGINAFLAANPSTHVVDVKLAASAAPVGNHITNYGAMALLLYKE